MRTLRFSVRVSKEILRDPLNLGFGIGFPIILLLLMTAIQSNIPVNLFEIERLSPGIAIFGLSFMTLFSAMVVSKDRESAFLQRLYATPMKALDFILGYTLPIILISILQLAVCFLFSVILGLDITLNIILAIVVAIPSAVFFISLGLMCGSVFNTKQVGGICGALLTNLTALTSGIWFDLTLVGGWFEKIAMVLPFANATELERAAMSGNYGDIWVHLAWVLGYAVVFSILAVLAFVNQMKKC